MYSRVYEGLVVSNNWPAREEDVPSTAVNQPGRKNMFLDFFDTLRRKRTKTSKGVSTHIYIFFVPGWATADINATQISLNSFR